MKLQFLRSVALLMVGAGIGPAWAQGDPAKSYPLKPVHVVVAFAAGAGTDIVARQIAQKLAETFGQPVVVDNKVGASGFIGTEFAAKSKPDGYTLMMAPSSAITINPVIYKKLPYSSTRDFIPISMAVTFPLFLVINSGEPIQSVPGLVEYLKANPQRANYAGSSGLFQLALELFKVQTGTKVEFVRYKGTNETAQAVMSGDVLMTITDAAAATAPLKSGKVRGLATTAPRRTAAFPDIPTMAEVGLPNLEVLGWMGMFAPAATPLSIVKKLEAEVVRAVRLPEFKERMNAMQVDPAGNTSEEFARIIASDLARWTEVAKAGRVEQID
jgi:tripartite-type tricarboxylate transporter receptor subunit TctC